jgi:hypothetical protein
MGVETAVLEGAYLGSPLPPSPQSTPSTPTTVNVSRNPSGMDDGRSPSGGADKQKGGKGGYVLDSRCEAYCRIHY